MNVQQRTFEQMQKRQIEMVRQARTDPDRSVRKEKRKLKSLVTEQLRKEIRQ